MSKTETEIHRIPLDMVYDLMSDHKGRQIYEQICQGQTFRGQRILRVERCAETGGYLLELEAPPQSLPDKLRRRTANVQPTAQDVVTGRSMVASSDVIAEEAAALCSKFHLPLRRVAQAFDDLDRAYLSQTVEISDFVPDRMETYTFTNRAGRAEIAPVGMNPQATFNPTTEMDYNAETRVASVYATVAIEAKMFALLLRSGRVTYDLVENEAFLDGNKVSSVSLVVSEDGRDLAYRVTYLGREVYQGAPSTVGQKLTTVADDAFDNIRKALKRQDSAANLMPRRPRRIQGLED